jgi:hypothetical protein
MDSMPKGRLVWAFLPFLALLSALVSATGARADDCVTLEGVIVGGECQVSKDKTVSGTLTFNETLHLLGGGIIRGVPGNSPTPINITITGDLVMENQSAITGGDGACSGGNPRNGVPINITVNGSVTTAPISEIRSNACSGGPITITTTGNNPITIGGQVESAGGITGTGGVQPPGGGPITIKAGCLLTVDGPGRVTSRGLDPGADLVHLEGCDVTILGRVESTGNGHAPPVNHCSRPDKPAPATACVEIWSGNSVLIDSTGTNHGELNADIGFAGGSNGNSWIDIAAGGPIAIRDGTGNDRTITVPGSSTGFLSQFAVHANMLGVNTGHGGVIHMVSKGSDVIASGNVAQANASPAGGKGGEIHIDASQAITLNGANVFAQGDINGTGGFGTGGKIGTAAAPVRAFNGTLSWTTGTGDVQPSGSPLPGGASGTVNLEGCGVNATANFPATAGTFTPTIINNVCGGAPALPSGVVLPSNCNLTCGPPQLGQIIGVKWNDLNSNGMLDPGETGLAAWQILLFQGTSQINSVFTDDAGSYTFPQLAPGTYVVCEVLISGWISTFPTSGQNCLSPGTGLGHQVTVAAGQTVSDVNFGNHFTQPPSASKTGRKWNDLNGNGVQDAGEPGIPGVQIHLFLAGDSSFHQVTTTNAQGDYSFTGIGPGTYRTCETLPAGTIQTFPTIVTAPPGELVVTCDGLFAGVSGLGYAFVVSEGTEAFAGNNFGNQAAPPAGQITGIKFNDLNGNGTRDADEPGLLVWQIHLFSGTTLLASTFTGARGAYTFSNLADGTYIVCESLQSGGWAQTFPTSGPSCPAPGSGFGHQVTIAGGQVVSGIDFGNRLPTPSAGVKTGIKFNDLNGNGVQDAGEPGLPGWQIHLFRNDDPTFHQQITTGDTGIYSFGGLAPGLYIVCEAPQTGWVQTAPSGLLRALPSGDVVVDCSSFSGVSGLGYAFLVIGNETHTGNDFGNRQSIVVTGQITGLKWNDLNGNGVQDTSEPLISGWVIHLFRSGDPSFHRRATTDASGNYSFAGLTPGSYTVCEALQAGWVQTAPTSGADCSSLPGASGRGFALTVAAGQTVPGINFGNHPTAAAIPTISEWVMLALALLMVGASCITLRPQRLMPK